MNKVARHPFRAAIVAAIAAIALGACTRSDRQEVRTETKQATNAAAGAIDNAALTTKVKAALIADELVKGTQINVDSSAGMVKLTGTVDTPAQVSRAVEVAKGVQGVRQVENSLTSSPSAAPGVVPGTQPPGTSPAATPAPNSMTPPATTAPTSSMSEPRPAAVAVGPAPGTHMSAMPGSSAMMSADVVRQVQQQLTDRGYRPGPIDGVMGPSTRSALSSFKRKQGLSGSDLDQATLQALGVARAG